MRFRFIEDRRAEYPVRILCEVLGVSPAGCYAWRPGPGVAAALEPKIAPLIFPKMLIVCDQWTRDVTSL